MVSRRRCLFVTITAILSAAAFASVSDPPLRPRRASIIPARALSKNAGRIVRLEEVLRIRDDGETSIFRSPRFFKLGPDGSLFFVDFAEGDRVYRYGPDGRLFYQAPEDGPRARGMPICGRASSSPTTGSGSCPGSRPRSWISAWKCGGYLRESRVEENSHGLWFLGTAEGKIYGIRDEVFSLAAFGSSGILQRPQRRLRDLARFQDLEEGSTNSLSAW